MPYVLLGQSPSYPHNWTHTLRLDKEPWSNKLVRKAANYGIDRVGICKNLSRQISSRGRGLREGQPLPEGLVLTILPPPAKAARAFQSRQARARATAIAHERA